MMGGVVITISSSTCTNEPIGEDLCARSVVVDKRGSGPFLYADCIVVVVRYIYCVVTRDSCSPTARWL